MQKAGKRPSLVKELKTTFVQGQPVKKKGEEGAEEADKTMEQMSEGWLAYKKRYLENKGVQDQSDKKKKVGIFSLIHIKQ